MTTKTIPRSPSPRGCSVPLMTHLTPEERAQLVKMADQEARSMSAMARLLIVQGMQRYQAQA
ncbi:hypothetical protein SAMN05216198_2058 [Halopseudomonas litoralis]|uniref:Uncharacterized protein n=1 Tax=Halopseudomonas litoralis TaxID=797277 RepID=A0A1H1SKP3_9GAMM|nr:hypothetical protein [Halopseudomonas litoralis]SDS48567.1 hypothetical protein SAMN05216198_2058 [Halopseudomonas litoralis]